MVPIGFTTGSLYCSGIPMEKVVSLYHSLGADAVELSFSTPDSLHDFSLSEETAKLIKLFGFVSIHAPWKEVRYSGSATDRIICKLKELCSCLPVNGIVLHPDTIFDFEKLDKSGLPFLLENMDCRKKYGTTPEQFKELKSRYGFGFVLDLEHAYEHDRTMQNAREFISVMGDRLSHFHVSGCTQSEIHVLSHLAGNKQSIAEILKMRIKVPKILEGVLLKDIEYELKNELEYVRSFEKN